MSGTNTSFLQKLVNYDRIKFLNIGQEPAKREDLKGLTSGKALVLVTDIRLDWKSSPGTIPSLFGVGISDGV